MQLQLAFFLITLNPLWRPRFSGFAFGFGSAVLIKAGNQGYLSINEVSYNDYVAPQRNSGVIRKKVIAGGYPAQYYPQGRQIQIEVPPQFVYNTNIFSSLLAFTEFVLKLIVIFFVRRVLYTLKRGMPFNIANAQYIGKIALLLFLIPIGRHILVKISENYLSAWFNVTFLTRFRLTEEDMLCISVSLLLAVLSYVLKQGVMMQQEQELTI